MYSLIKPLEFDDYSTIRASLEKLQVCACVRMCVCACMCLALAGGACFKLARLTQHRQQ